MKVANRKKYAIHCIHICNLMPGTLKNKRENKNNSINGLVSPCSLKLQHP